MISEKYQDMLYMKRPKPIKEPMTMKDRAAQFAPFAALEGHSEQIQETQRQTEKKKNLDESLKQEIDFNIKQILEKIKTQPTIKITHYEKDKLKDGGKYKTEIKTLAKYDYYTKTLIFTDKTTIQIQNILKIEEIK